jgi:uridylate kinase
MQNKYKRIVLKISGESLLSDKGHDIFDSSKLDDIAKTIKLLHENDVEIGVVIGAGNIFRGKLSEKTGIDHTDADCMGMLGTLINCLAISSKLEKIGVPTRVLSAIPMNKVCEEYNYKNARRYLKEHIVVFYAGGTGNPFCTTDSCAALRALETHSDAILMGKNGIDGVYDKDPNLFKDAKFIKNLTYEEILKLDLKVIDQSSAAMLKGHNVEVKIFSAKDTNNFLKVINGEDIGTTIKEN